MNKNTMFPNLLQKIITDDELEVIKKVVHYQDTARKLTVFHLVQYFIAAAANEWKSYRSCADVGSSCGLPKVDHSTISKKASNMDFLVMKKLFELIISKCNRATRRGLTIPKSLLLIDSTTITVGKNRLPWAVYHGERAGVKLHVSYTPETDMPLRVIESVGLKHDGPVGEGLADSRFILVQDRAYFKISRIDQFDEQRFVIRMKDNVEISQARSLRKLDVEGSRVTRDITCKVGTRQCRSEKRHRIVFFVDDHGREMRVITNIMNVTAETIADMYKARWQIESFFRWVKQNVNLSVLFGTTENAVYNQLYAALIAYVLLRWLYDRIGVRRVFSTMSFVSFQRKFLTRQLPVDWLSEMAAFLKEYSTCHGRILSKFG
jgi:hypothetical protein